MAGIPPLSVSGEVYRGSKFSSAGHVGQVAGFGSFPEDRLNFLPVRTDRPGEREPRGARVGRWAPAKWIDFMSTAMDGS